MKPSEISSKLQEIVGPERLTDAAVNQKIAEMEAARKARNFKASDALRDELIAGGINVQITKDGVRWRRRTGYKTKLNPLGPVAIKLNQWEVHAPQHGTWGIVSCDGCKERFALGPNLIYGTHTTPDEAVKELEDLLKADHQNDRPHANSYELTG
jgi:hypothetical protein